MTKKIISKIGDKRLPDVDMMEFIQIDDIKEFDLDKNFPDVERTIESAPEEEIDVFDFKVKPKRG